MNLYLRKRSGRSFVIDDDSFKSWYFRAIQGILWTVGQLWNNLGERFVVVVISVTLRSNKRIDSHLVQGVLYLGCLEGRIDANLERMLDICYDVNAIRIKSSNKVFKQLQSHLFINSQP